VRIWWWNAGTAENATAKVSDFAKRGVLKRYGGPVDKGPSQLSDGGRRCVFREAWRGGLGRGVFLAPWQATYVIQAVKGYVFEFQLKEGSGPFGSFVKTSWPLLDVTFRLRGLSWGRRVATAVYFNVGYLWPVRAAGNARRFSAPVTAILTGGRYEQGVSAADRLWLVRRVCWPVALFTEAGCRAHRR